MTSAAIEQPSDGLFGWWRAGDAPARRALIAASLGWMLDAFDVMLFALVTASIIADLGITKTQAGLVGSVTLLGGAAGGLLFGHLADRFGRTRALMASVLLYSVFTAMCGFAQTLTQLMVIRVLLGMGMVGEWASGAALVSETWPAKHRGRAFGFMQGSWAIGFGTAAAVNWYVLPRFGWRAVFFVGVVPALFVFWIQRYVEEPKLWLARKAAQAEKSDVPKARFSDIFRGRAAVVTSAVMLMNACTLFGWWGLNGWVPARLSLPVAQGGLGLSGGVTSGLVIAMQIGMWFGYVSFGYITDAVGRKRMYVLYLLVAAALLPIYGFVHRPLILLVLGPVVAFFGTGFFSGFGALTAELYPTGIRATAQGFTYNIGRIASAAAPFTVGKLATTRGFGAAFAVIGVVYLLAAASWIWIPETKGRALE